MVARFLRPRRVGMLLLLVPFTSGCTLKYMQNSLDDEWFDERKRSWKPPLELGAMTNDLGVGPSALTLSLQSSNLYLDRETVPPLEEFDDVSIGSWSGSARLIPIRDLVLRPYVGGGYGRSYLATHWRGPNYDRSRYDCYGACTRGFGRGLSSGWHGHWLAGLEFGNPGARGLSLLVEYRRDIGRGDVFYDLGGSSLSFGLRRQINLN